MLAATAVRPSAASGSRNTMQASTSSPRTGSGVAATAEVFTAGCWFSTLSTSTAEMFSPLRRMTFFLRSTK